MIFYEHRFTVVSRRARLLSAPLRRCRSRHSGKSGDPAQVHRKADWHALDQCLLLTAAKDGPLTPLLTITARLLEPVMLEGQGQALYGCTAEFRLFWVASRMAETDAADAGSNYNAFSIAPVPVFSATIGAAPQISLNRQGHPWIFSFLQMLSLSADLSWQSLSFTCLRVWSLEFLCLMMRRGALPSGEGQNSLVTCVV